MNVLTVPQAAEIMQQSREAVRNYITSGKLKATKEGRRYIIAKADLYEFLIKPLEDERRKADANKRLGLY